jgi:hypothetical protein
MSILPTPPADAVALTAFRELASGRGVKYTEAWFPANPWQGCEHFIRTCGALGFLRESSADFKAYALLDVVDEDGEIVATYDVTTAQAWRYIYRKLKLRVAPIPPGEAGNPPANAGIREGDPVNEH